MAESEKVNASPRSEAIQTSLEQARDIIVQLLNGVSPQNTSELRETHALPRQQNEPERLQYLHNRSSMEEHRRLFGFTAGQTLSSSTSQSRTGKRKLCHARGGKSPKKSKGSTWTHAFVCLSKRLQFLLPSPQERYELKRAGLGEKKYPSRYMERDLMICIKFFWMNFHSYLMPVALSC